MGLPGDDEELGEKLRGADLGSGTSREMRLDEGMDLKGLLQLPKAIKMTCPRNFSAFVGNPLDDPQTPVDAKSQASPTHPWEIALLHFGVCLNPPNVLRSTISWRMGILLAASDGAISNSLSGITSEGAFPCPHRLPIAISI